MQRPLKITCRDFDLTPAVETEVRQKADALDTYYNRLSGCEVTIQAPAILHHRKGGPFLVAIRMTVPGKELIVDHQPKEELSQAIREAFDAARRRLEDYAREQRRQVKTHEPSLLGRVVQLSPEMDCGSLETSEGREIYFHRNSVLNGAFDQLQIGSTVRYAEEEGEQGPQASSVTILKK